MDDATFPRERIWCVSRPVDQKQHACATNHDKKDEERQQALASFSIRPQPVSA
jgi:hypothetical protein